MSLPQFNPAVMPSHDLIKSLVKKAGLFLWMNDIELIELRKILGLRPDIRYEFLTALSVVTQTLIAQCYYTPIKLENQNNKNDVLFTFSEHINITTLAQQCTTSRSTVRRVIYYLELLGDVKTKTLYNKETQRYSPTEIVINSSLFTRIGMSYASLKNAVQSLTKFENERYKKKQRAHTKLLKRIKKSRLSDYVLKALGSSTTRILNVDSNPLTNTEINNGAVNTQQPKGNATTQTYINTCKTYTSVSDINSQLNSNSSAENARINAQKQYQADFLFSLTRKIASLTQLSMREAGVKAAVLFRKFGFDVTDSEILKV